MLFDTGAAYNLISSYIAPEKLGPATIPSMQLACVDRNAQVLGSCVVSINIKGVDYNVFCWVLKNLDTPIILGSPFLTKERVVLDYSRQCLYIGREKRQTVFWARETFIPEGQIILPVAKADTPKEIMNLVQEFKELFQIGPVQPTTRDTQHIINITSNKIIHERCFPMNPRKKKLLYDIVEDLLNTGVISPSTSAYSTSPIIVEKPDKKPRLCMNFQSINAMTTDESAVLPRIQDALKDLTQAKYFTTLDLKSGYWQIPMDPASKKYTAFSTPDGASYEYNVMPFGLKNAPGSFQKLMTAEVLVGFIQQFVIVYLDDIVIYSDNLEEHYEHVRLVFERLAMHNLKIAGEKCQLATTDIEYLGYHIKGEETVPLSKHKIQIKNFTMPQNKKQVQSFLGICNWLREYIPRLAELTAPLSDLLKKDSKFKLTEKQFEAFENTKIAVENSTPLHRPDYSKKFILQTDSSGIGMAALLYQQQGEQKHIIAHASAKFSKTTQKYHINEQECLAIVWAIKMFRGYLEDKPFTVRTDSKALTWLAKFKDHRSKLMRWALLLQEFSFEVEHIPGRENQLCDYLSRNPALCPYEEFTDEDRMLAPANINIINKDKLLDQIQKVQQSTEHIRRTVRMLENLETEMNLGQGPTTKQEKRLHKTLCFKNGLLCKISPEGERIIVPRKLQDRVIYLYHDEENAAHPGIDETYNKIRKQFYWGYQKNSIADYIRKCKICGVCKTQQKQETAPLRANNPKYPFQVISMDILGPYTPAADKTDAKYILVCEDIFSKWVEAKALKNVYAKDVTLFLQNEIIARYGNPEILITDNGGAFKGNILKKFCENQNITQQFTAIHHQQANPVERRIQELKKVLRVLTYKKRANSWEEYLPRALQTLRSRICRATGQSPAAIILGYELPPPGEWTEKWPLVRENLTKEERQKKNKAITRKQSKYINNEINNESEPKVELDVGDMVNIRAWQKNKGPFSPAWNGSHEIVKKINDVVYEVLVNDKQVPVHINDMRLEPTGNFVNFDSDYENTEDELSEPEFPDEYQRCETVSNYSDEDSFAGLITQNNQPVNLQNNIPEITIDEQDVIPEHLENLLNDYEGNISQVTEIPLYSRYFYNSAYHNK